MNIGDFVVLSCEVDSNPEAHITWSLNDKEIFYYPKLVIGPFKKENYGVYKCRATLRDYPPVFSQSILLPPGPPIIETETVQYGYFASQGSIYCIFKKEPSPSVNFLGKINYIFLYNFFSKLAY